jgi:cell division ATPase FtsA
MHGEPEAVMIFDMGADTTKIFIVEGRILRETHIVNRGSQDITAAISQSLTIDTKKAEELKREVGVTNKADAEGAAQAGSIVLDSILNEGKRAMLAYEKKHHTTISKVILSGGGSILKGLSEMATGVFESEVEIANPFSKIETPAFLEDVLKTAGPEFAVAIGVALRKLDELS